MRNAIAALLATSMVASVLLVAACGDDDDGDAGAGDPCTQQLQIEEDAITDYCADKAAVCCLCLCWQDYHSLYSYDSAQYALDGTCVCQEPEVGDQPACEGYTLDYANNCIADPTACGAAAVTGAETLCDNTPLP